jgi:hypothetical protein
MMEVDLDNREFAEHAALPWWPVSAILFGLIIYCLLTLG